MNYRERYINTLLYKPVDRIPLEPGHPRLSTLRRWRAEGLPEDADYFKYVMDLLRIDMDYPAAPDHRVNSRMMPEFEEKVLSHENSHYIVQDWMGAITEISDQYDYTYIRNAIDFVTRKWHKFPVETYDDWQEMKKRYDPLDPARLPRSAGNLAAIMKNRDYISRFSVNGPFWQLREWMGFENLCMAFIEQPGFVSEMIGFWCDFVLRLFDIAADIIPFDCFSISEDMAYKAHSMISPDMTREFLLPVYIKWVATATAHHVPLIDMDSDGYIEELIPIWIEAGINVCDPIEVAAHNDIARFKEKFGDEIAYRGGIDKRAIAAGGGVMENEVLRVTAPFACSGGLIPGCDHGVPHDISFGDYVAYTKLLAQLTGWL